MRNSWLRGLLASALVCAGWGPSVAHADESSDSKKKKEKSSKTSEENSDDEGDSEDDEETSRWGGAETDVESESGKRIQSGDKNWSVSLSLSTRIGQGTFANTKNDTNTPARYQSLNSAFDSARLGYDVSASYRLDDFIFSAGIGWTQGLSPSVGVEDPQQIWFNDTSLRVNWTGYKIEPIDTTVTANLGVGLPTGLTSQTTTQVLGLNASTSIRRTFFKRLTLKYSLGGGKNFHRYKVPAVDVDEVGANNYLHERDLDRGLAAIQGVNSEWSMSHRFAASVRIWDKLSGSVSYSYSRSWTYNRETNDRFQPPQNYVDSGRGVGDFISTSISLSYPFAEYFSASGGLYSSSFPKTADQRSMNFPFWNFAGAAGNESGLFLSLSGSY